jgi:ribosome biogenesis GTPase
LTTLPGLVIKSQSGFFTVRTEQGDVVCHVRGRLKQHRQATNLVAVGDHVQISQLAEDSGMIENVEPRRSVLSRRAPGARGRAGPKHSSRKDGPVDESEAEQVIVANPDQVLLVFASAQPEPHLRMLDRFLVMAEVNKLPVVIVANKADLLPAEQAQALFAVYPSIGYRVIHTSAADGTGLEELRTTLAGKLSVLSGPSGVGKSSLLNALQPGLGLKAREVSQATFKGRHTTVYAELLPLEMGGYVADTPGIRSLSLWDVEPEELDAYFVEIGPYVDQCEFNDCTHTHEPGCAVLRAVEQGKIAKSRYESYVRLREGD